MSIFDPASVDLAGLLAQAADAFFVLNERGKLVFANAAFQTLFGWTNDEPNLQATLETELLRRPADLAPGQLRQVERPWGRGNRRRWLHIVFLPLGPAAEGTAAVLGHVSTIRPPEAIPKPVESLLSERLAKLREQQIARFGFAAVPAQSEAMVRVLHQLKIAIATAEPVTFIGEIGTGKTTLARIVHHQSMGKVGTLAVLDAAALPVEIQRQQLLGRLDLPEVDSPEARGILRAPGVGTLFLKHASQLAHDLQDEVVKVFGGRKHPWRLMVTERQPLDALLAEGRLRESLYYLISTLVISLPPLRERRADLPPCCDWILDRLRERPDFPARAVDAAALDALRQYDWPGNLRELEMVLLQAGQRAQTAVIMPRDLPRRLARPDRSAAAPASELPKPPPLDSVLEQVERRLLQHAANRFRGNKAKAAEYLGISRPRFHRRWEQLGLGEDTMMKEEG